MKDDVLVCRDIPNDLSPAEASYFLREKVDLNMVYGTLLHLTNQNTLSLERVDGDHIFTLIQKKEGADAVEQYLLEWLFTGEGSFVSMQAFKEKYGDQQGKSSLFYNLQSLEPIVVNGIKHLYADLGHKKKVLNYLTLPLICIILIVSVPTFGEIALFPSIFFFFWLLVKISRLMKKNQTGRESYIKWFGFSLFLQEQMDASRRETLEVILWDDYMAYAVALGIASASIDELDWLAGNIVEAKQGGGYITYL